MRKKTALIILLIFAMTIPVQARTKTKAELIQEALLNGQAANSTTSEIINTESETESAAEESPEGTAATDSTAQTNEGQDQTTSAQTDANAETGSETEMPEQADAQSVPEPVIDRNIPFEEIDARILALDTRHPDHTEVKSLRASFEQLDTAQKLKIKNIQLLINAEAIVDKEENGPQEKQPEEKKTKQQESKGNVLASSYNFWVGKGSEQLSIIARMVTDDNKDGISEKPTFTLTGPSGVSVTITAQSQNINDSTMNIDCTMADSYFQMDIAKLIEGDWTVSSSIPVVFQRSEYLGAAKIEPETKEEVKETKNTKIKVDYGPAIRSSLMILGITGALLAFLFFVRRYFGPQDEGKKKSSGIKPKIPSVLKPKGKKEESEDTQMDSKKAEEEMLAQIRKEMEEERRLSEQWDKEAEERDKKTERKRNTEFEEEEKTNKNEVQRLDVTTMDYEEEELEEFVEHVGDTGILNKKEQEAAPPKKKQFGGRFG